MDRRRYAVWTLALGLVIGLVGNLFFYGKPLGLSVPLFALVVIAAVLGSAALMRLPLNARKLWPLIPLLFFAVMVAVRADVGITLLNVLAIFGLGALVLHYLPLTHSLDEDTLGDYARGGLEATARVSAMPVGQAVESGRWLREQRSLQQGPVLAVGRGLLLTVPVLAVFAVLLGSADAVFAGYLNQAWQMLSIRDVDDLFWQGVVIGGLGWLGCGALAYGVARQVPAEGEEARPTKRAKRHPFTLGMIEAGMMLGGVTLLFALFVFIQFAYFFGGQANITVEGFTYAEYARRGFFELVAVSVLTLGFILWLDWVTVRHTARQARLFRGMAVVMVALTGVILVSAAQRMTLYEQTYGFTHLRVYTHVFIVWMAALFGVFLLSLFRVRERIFSVGTLVVIIGYLMTLNVMNVEQYIAEHNVARYLDAKGTHEIDICYLRTMSVDALPAMLTLYRAPETSEDVRADVWLWLSEQLWALERMNENVGARVLAFNAARASAWQQLNAIRDSLAAPGLSANTRYCGYGFYGLSSARYD